MIRVGPAGWSYADWEGIVYPRKKPSGFHPLRHLARYVDCVEINSTFYATPRADFAQRWVRCIEDRPDFRFTAKLQNVFTHEPLPRDASVFDDLVRDYLAGIEPLRAAERLAALLVQFPLSFRRTTAAEQRLARIESAFGRIPLVLEVRHRSWFEPDAVATIARLGYSLARIDLPAGPDHPPADAPTPGEPGYLRLHGRNADTWFDARAGRDQRYDYLYTPGEIGALATVARRLGEEKNDAFVIANNHFAGQAVANALEILAALGSAPPRAPVELIEAFPRLREHTRPDGQTTLF